jgi:DNA-binding SARP family transcriptional activator
VTAGGDVEILVLGPVLVRVGGQRVTTPRGRPLELLCRLLVEEGRPVSTQRLLDDVWGAPDQTGGVVRTTVNRLRAALGGAERVVVWTGEGYALSSDRVDVDADRFLAALERSRTADTPLRVRELDDALRLWRGDVFGELHDHLSLALYVHRLEVLRDVAIEDHYEALLADGHDRDIVPGLRVLVDRHPYRERLAETLAVATYRAGRQVEALEVVRVATARLRTDLGIEPSAGLVDLEHRILSHDPSLSAVRGGSPQPVRAPTRLDAAVRSTMALHELGALDEAARVAATAVDEARATGRPELVVRELCRRARLLGLARQGASGLGLLTEAEDTARRSDDGEALAEAALARFHFDIGFDERSVTVARLVEPLRLLPLQSRLRIDLLGAAVFQMAFSRDTPDADAVLREIERLTQWSTDPRAASLSRTAHVLIETIRGSATLGTGERAADAVASVAVLDDPWFELVARLGLVAVQLSEGRVDQVLDSLDELDRLARRTLVPFAWLRVRLLEVMASLAGGQLDGLEAVALEIRSAGEAMAVRSASGSVFMQLLTLWMEQGRYGAIRAVADSERRIDGASAVWDVISAFVDAVEGRPDVAERVEAISQDHRWRREGWRTRLSAGFLVEAAWRTGAADAAARAATSLHHARGRFLVAGHSTVVHGPVDRVLGLAALACGRADEAVDLLTEAVRLCDQGGVHLWGARSRLDLATALAGRRSDGDLAEAQRLVDAVGATRLTQQSARLATEMAEARRLLEGGVAAPTV